MAHNIEPMDIDQIDSDFDNKENSIHHNNVYPRTPCTEKGYEELDVSELNMKLRYSMTPISTPMSKSYTANCSDNKVLESSDIVGNPNLTRSFNSTVSKNDINKSAKSLPLQAMTTDQFHDNNRNTSVLRPIDTTAVISTGNTTITVVEPNDMDENLSTPSSLSSNAHTPEVTTPTKETLQSDGGSPIMRGLKTVLNMFRSSQSPIPTEKENNVGTQALSPPDLSANTNVLSSDALLASTPIAHKNNEGNVSKRNSPLKESIVFNEDLERELLWKDESTVLFNEEKIPIHKLLFQQPLPNISGNSKPYDEKINDDLNSTVEYMDISYNDTLQNKTITCIQSEGVSNVVESEGEFEDCETTFNSKLETSCAEERLNNTLGNENIKVSKFQATTAIETKDIVEVHINKVDEEPSDITQILEKEDTTHPTIQMYNSNVNEFKSVSTREVVIEKGKENNIVNEEYTLTKTDRNIEDNLSLSREVRFCECPLTDDEAKLQQNFEFENIHVQDITNTSREVKLSSFKGPNIKDTTHFNKDSQVSTAEEEINKTMDDNCELPANIPLPDEDEIESNLDGTNSVISDTKIDNNTKNIDYLPNKSLDQDKLNGLNKIVNESTAVGSKIECNIEIAHTLPNEWTNKAELLEMDKTIDVNTSLESKSVDIEQAQVLTSTETIESNLNFNGYINITIEGESEVSQVTNILRQDLLTDIDNIISDTHTCINLQQQQLLLNSPQLDIPLEKHSEEDQLTDNSLNNDTTSLQPTVLMSDIENLHEVDCHNQLTEKSTNSDVVDKSPSNLQDNQFDMSIDGEIITNNQNTLNVIEHNVNGTLDNHLKENNALEVTESSMMPEVNCVEKMESLPDLIPEAVSEMSVTIPRDLKTETVILQTSVEEKKQDKSMPKINNTEDNVDVEIILSKNNSPYISIDHEIQENQEHFAHCEDIVNTNTSQATIIRSPPTSPKIVSKGYNFNFDDIDDPFATKTKIRMSPPLNSPKSTFSMEKPLKNMDKNRRKSQSERKKPLRPKKNMNATFAGSTNLQEGNTVKNPVLHFEENCTDIKEKRVAICKDNNLSLNTNESVSNAITTIKIGPSQSIEIKPSAFCANTEDNTNNEKYDEIVNKENNETMLTKEPNIATEDSKSSLESLSESMEVKNTSPLEQSTYYSAATSSGESSVSKNVFNIPEIDDMNFNPFITKSKMHQSPAPEILINENSSQLNEPTQFIENPHDNVVTTFEEKECIDASNTTCSSKSTDEKNITVQEVYTEDEDTIEGPFLETEDLNTVDKISNFDDNDLMMFAELPKEGNEDNLDGGELFIDAEAFEFLLNQNQNNAVADSAKESLFLKFDPLFAKRVSSDGVLSVLKQVQRRQTTPKKISVAQQMNSTFEKPTPGPSNRNITIEMNATAEESTEDLNITMTKPMMVVTPAVNPVVTPRNKSITPTSSNRRSITFTSPAIAVIDRLLCMSGNNSMLGDSTVAEVNREQNEAELALTQLRELLADKEIHVYNLRSETKELRDRLTNLESQMRTLETESEERLKKVNELNERLSEKTKINKSMAAVVEEYERTIASLIAETEQDRKRHNEERIKLIQERDEQTAHLASMEVSFNDLHSKYEKSKQIILSCKSNEDAYKKSIKEFEDNVTKMQSNYELLKQHATSKLNHANQELEKMNRAHESEVLKLNAMIKRKDLHITSLEETLAQKTKANEELAAICDELINKVG